MAFTVALLVCFLAVTVSANSDDVDPNALHPTHIVCGKLTNKTEGPAQLGKFPWLAYLEYRVQHQHDIQRLKCLGSLINKRYIMTSAECVNKTEPLRSVLLGGHGYHELDDEHSHHGKTRRYYIEKVIMHANYSRHPLPMNDIALIKLNSTVHFSETIRPVCLPHRFMDQPKSGDMLLASTMSQNQSTWMDSVSMQKVRNTMVQYPKCMREYQKLNLTIRAEHMCTMTAYDSPYTCTNDHGGPLIHMKQNRQQYVQEGIVSYERECDSYFPKLNTNVREFRQWIMRHMNMHQEEESSKSQSSESQSDENQSDEN